MDGAIVDGGVFVRLSRIRTTVCMNVCVCVRGWRLCENTMSVVKDAQPHICGNSHTIIRIY